jgi:hypothetical protein
MRRARRTGPLLLASLAGKKTERFCAESKNKLEFLQKILRRNLFNARPVNLVEPFKSRAEHWLWPTKKKRGAKLGLNKMAGRTFELLIQ